ncbi:hypothetical protein D3C77_398020 [compost metagenome]
MCRNSIVTILRLALCWPLVVGLAVAADISVTSTFKPDEAVPTCDATAGAGLGGYSTPDGAARDWFSANRYCTDQGLRLPTRDELISLYYAYINGAISTTCGWPSGDYYWSSTEYSATAHYGVDLIDGDTRLADDGNADYVTCVR